VPGSWIEAEEGQPLSNIPRYTGREALIDLPSTVQEANCERVGNLALHHAVTHQLLLKLTLFLVVVHDALRTRARRRTGRMVAGT
jgi:hypothetical protein